MEDKDLEKGSEEKILACDKEYIKNEIRNLYMVLFPENDKKKSIFREYLLEIINNSFDIFDPECENPSILEEKIINVMHIMYNSGKNVSPRLKLLHDNFIQNMNINPHTVAFNQYCKTATFEISKEKKYKFLDSIELSSLLAIKKEGDILLYVEDACIYMLFETTEDYQRYIVDAAKCNMVRKCYQIVLDGEKQKVVLSYSSSDKDVDEKLKKISEQVKIHFKCKTEPSIVFNNIYDRYQIGTDYMKDNFNFNDNRKIIDGLCNLIEETYPKLTTGLGSFRIQSDEITKKYYIQFAISIHQDNVNESIIIYNPLINLNIEENSKILKCRSNGEKVVCEYLIRNNIEFEKEKTFNGCVYINKLRLDFYIPKYNLAIEFHGKQHYEMIEFFHRNQENFELAQNRDKIKKQFCLENNIKLLIISYLDECNIVSILDKVLTTDNQVQDLSHISKSIEIASSKLSFEDRKNIAKKWINERKPEQDESTRTYHAAYTKEQNGNHLSERDFNPIVRTFNYNNNYRINRITVWKKNPY